MTNQFDIADLLVRWSNVPLARIAAVLDFADPEGFSRWFEGHTGLHPEVARADWEASSAPASSAPASSAPASSATASSATAEPEASDGPDNQRLVQVRRCLMLMQGQPDLAPIVRAMRRRRPIPEPPSGGRHA